MSIQLQYQGEGAIKNEPLVILKVIAFNNLFVSSKKLSFLG